MLDKKEITTLAQDRIDEIDNEVFIVELTISASNHISIEIDRMEGGISIQECIRVSRNVEHNLDREVEDFSLQVSSAGFGSPFRVAKQFIKNIDTLVKVVMAHGSHEGILKSFEEGKQIVIETESKEKIEGKKKKEMVKREHIISFDDIKEVKRVITFKK